MSWYAFSVISFCSIFRSILSIAEISELILMHVLDDEDMAADMADALRATFYSYHEDRVRRRCRLPKVLGERATRRVHSSVSDLRERADEIMGRATAARRSTSAPRCSS